VLAIKLSLWHATLYVTLVLDIDQCVRLNMHKCSLKMLYLEKLKAFSSVQFDLFVCYIYFHHTDQNCYECDWVRKIYFCNLGSRLILLARNDESETGVTMQSNVITKLSICAMYKKPHKNV
jgi:hypothetical protein